MSLIVASLSPLLQTTDPLEHAILETLAYSDIFDYPLTLDELHKFLTVSAEKREIAESVSRMDGVSVKDGYFFLTDHPEIVEVRRQREAGSRDAFARAMFYGRIIGKLPFVRMVALTGSLAMLNLSKNKDMDYMLVTKSGRVWTARAFALLFGRFVRLFGDVICPNVIVSETALEWGTRNLYTAREFAQMIPISGVEVYRRLRVVNSWVFDILPNTAAPPASSEMRQGGAGKLPQSIFEYLLANRFGDFFESWEMNRKIRRFKKQSGFGIETKFNAEVCQGNFDHHGTATLDRLYQRMQQFGDMSKVKPVSERVGGLGK